MKLNNFELNEVVGGATSLLTSSFINAVTNSVSTLFEVGQSIGSSIRRVYTKTIC